MIALMHRLYVSVIVILLLVLPLGFVRSFSESSTYKAWEQNASGDIVTLLPLPDISGDGTDDLFILSADGPIYSVNGITGQRLWNYTPASIHPWLGAITSSPLQVNGDSKSEILVAAKNGLIVMLDGATGRPLWNYTMVSDSSYKYGNPCFPEIRALHLISSIDNDNIPDAVIISGTSDQCSKDDSIAVLALEAQNGRKSWEFSRHEDYHSLKDGTKGSNPSTILDIDSDGTDDVILADDHGTLYTINGANGNLINAKKLAISGAIWNLIHLPDLTGDGIDDVLGLEFIDGQGGPNYASIDALDVKLNKVIWQTKLGDGLHTSGALYSAILVSENPDTNQSMPVRVAVTERVEGNQNLVLLNAMTGDQIWQFSLGTHVGGDDLEEYYPMAMTPDLNGDGADELAIGKKDSTFYILNESDASAVWSYSVGGATTGITFLSGQEKQRYIIVGNSHSAILALAGSTTIPTKITLESSDLTITPSSKVIISGVVSPSFPGDLVLISYVDPTRVVTTRSLIIARDGSFTDITRPELIGTWHVSAKFFAKGYYLDSESKTISFSVMNETENEIFSLHVKNGDREMVSYPIAFNIEGGKISSMSINYEQKSLNIWMDQLPPTADASGGRLRIELPKNVIDTGQSKYQVFVDGKDAAFEELSGSDAQVRVLSIPFTSGAEQIQIKGTVVVPEFSSTIAILASITVVLIATSRVMNLGRLVRGKG